MDITRIEKVQAWMQREEIPSLFIENPTDLFYLTSAVSGSLVLSSQEAPLFVRSLEIEKAKTKYDNVQKTKDLSNYLNHQGNITFDSASTTCDRLSELQKMAPNTVWKPLSKPLKTLRAIKDPHEIKALKKAAKLTYEGYKHVKSLLKEGVTEEALSFAFQIFCQKNGASKLSFEPIIAFGENSAYPHHRASKAALQPNQIVLFDLGAIVDDYAGDMTRTVFFGTPDPQLEKDYKLLQKTQKLVLSHIRPGICFGELNEIARNFLKKEDCEHLFIHGLSHGIGLDVHEYPGLRFEGGDLNFILQEGVVFTVEPGIYRPSLGGVRYEDTVLVTSTGYENFYPSESFDSWEKNG